MNRAEVIAKIGEIAEKAAQPEGIEIVDIELKGGGKHQVLLIVIDKVAGVTHTETHIAFRTYSRHDLEAAFSIGYAEA